MLLPERPCAHAAPDIAGSASSPPPSSGAAVRTAAPSRHSRPPPILAKRNTPIYSCKINVLHSSVGAGHRSDCRGPRLVDRRCRLGRATLRPWTSGAPADNSLHPRRLPCFGTANSQFRNEQGIGRKPFRSRRDPASGRPNASQTGPKSAKFAVIFPVGREFASRDGTRSSPVPSASIVADRHQCNNYYCLE